jgi:hypothetical protein
MRVSTEGSGFGRNDNLPSLGRICLLEMVQNLQTGAQPYDTCLAWTPQIHSHGIWCDVCRRILTETTICHRGKWIPAFLWNDAEKSTRDDQPCLYSPLHRRPLWNTLNLFLMYEGKYRGQWLWEKQQSTVAGTDLPTWNGAKPPNWSMAIPILALHEVETPPTSPKSIYMVSGVMLVEGYWLRQQSATVVSEYLPSFETTRKSWLEMTNRVSTLHCTGDLCEILWTFL